MPRCSRVFDDAGFETARALQGGVVEVVLQLDRTRPAVVERRDERDHVAVAASLKPFFEPLSVAVIGASSRRGTIGGELFRNILAADFAGAAYPVNRGGEPVGGVPGYADIADARGRRSGCHVRPRRACARRRSVGARNRRESVCVISAGFAETGAGGKERQDELLALVRAHGAASSDRTASGSTNTDPAERDVRAGLPAGRIGFSSQSGALGLAILE